MSSAERRITRDEYQTAIAVAERETAPPATPRVTRFELAGQLRRDGVEQEVHDELLDNLVARGHLVRIDYQSRPEAVADDQVARTWYAPADEETLLRWIQAEARTELPDQELIGKLNRERQRLGGGSE